MFLSLQPVIHHQTQLEMWHRTDTTQSGCWAAPAAIGTVRPGKRPLKKTFCTSCYSRIHQKDLAFEFSFFFFLIKTSLLWRPTVKTCFAVIISFLHSMPILSFNWDWAPLEPENIGRTVGSHNSSGFFTCKRIRCCVSRVEFIVQYPSGFFFFLRGCPKRATPTHREILCPLVSAFWSVRLPVERWPTPPKKGRDQTRNGHSWCHLIIEKMAIPLDWRIRNAFPDGDNGDSHKSRQLVPSLV
jgi:hypothetical protein